MVDGVVVGIQVQECAADGDRDGVTDTNASVSRGEGCRFKVLGQGHML
jgi:hypothetical protein